MQTSLSDPAKKIFDTRLTAEQRTLLIRCVDGELTATRRMARSNFNDRTLAAEFESEADRQETLLGLLRRAVSVSVSVSDSG